MVNSIDIVHISQQFHSTHLFTSLFLIQDAQLESVKKVDSIQNTPTVINAIQKAKF